MPRAPPLKRNLLLLGSILAGGSIYYSHHRPRSPESLNDTTFVPYAITSRDPVSPTSFIFTLSPRHEPSRLPLGQWSVEFKHPQVQIARHYTPLPPYDGLLNFYVRAVPAGEMSSYLARLAVGDDVWLRGPHEGFDVLRRLGARRGGQVVFLAGGTGIAPGLQVARAVLEEGEGRVTILWAVRSRDELQAGKPRWSWTRSLVDVYSKVGLEGASPVGKRLLDMKDKYGERLRIRVAIDDERTTFREGHLRDALTSVGQRPPLGVRGCRFHDPGVLEGATEFDPHDEHACACPVPGKNLLIISGPEGFVEHYAGAKVWKDGEQLQGPVGGVAGALQSKDARLAQDWLVLKL